VDLESRSVRPPELGRFSSHPEHRQHQTSSIPTLRRRQKESRPTAKSTAGDLPDVERDRDVVLRYAESHQPSADRGVQAGLLAEVRPHQRQEDLLVLAALQHTR
jgi:hypothetical protein